MLLSEDELKRVSKYFMSAKTPGDTLLSQCDIPHLLDHIREQERIISTMEKKHIFIRDEVFNWLARALLCLPEKTPSFEELSGIEIPEYSPPGNAISALKIHEKFLNELMKYSASCVG